MGALLKYLNQKSITLWLISTAYLVSAAFFSFAGPRLPVEGGLGWDGQVFGKCSIDFVSCIEKVTLSDYSITRLFPSALVNFMYQVTQLKANIPNTVVLFSIMNFIESALILILLLLISRQLQWKSFTTAFAILAILFSFAGLRMPFYVPVWTDTTALLLSTLALWAFLTKRKLVLGLTIVPAGFTWPAAIPVIAILLVINDSGDNINRLSNKKALLFAATITVAFSGLIYFFVWSPYGIHELINEWIIFSTLISVCLCFWFSYSFICALGKRKISMNKQGFMILSFFCVLYFAATTYLHQFADIASPQDPYKMIRAIAITGLMFPAIILSAHAVYLGPWIIYFMVKLKAIMSNVSMPIILVSIMGVGLSFITESRIMTFMIPFMVFAAATYVDRLAVGKLAFIIFATGSIVSSRFWLDMHSGRFGTDLNSFPAQLFLMHMGPWMSYGSYLLSIIALLVSILSVWPLLRSKIRPVQG